VAAAGAPEAEEEESASQGVTASMAQAWNHNLGRAFVYTRKTNLRGRAKGAICCSPNHAHPVFGAA